MESDNYMDQVGYLKDVHADFARLRDMAERAMVQVSDESFFAVPGPEMNSIAILVKHIGGNLKSRWSDFLTSDGEKPDRNRDMEFELLGEDTRSILLQQWNRGWETVLDTLASLKPTDLSATVMIRREPHTVIQAINRQLIHYAYHVGQIVMLARMAVGQEWKTLSVPRGGSEKFNQNPTKYLSAEDRDLGTEAQR